MKSHNYFLINVFLVFFFLIISQPALSKVPSGDIAPLGNRDGAVNVGDALVALRFALSLETPTQKDIEHGDVSPLDANGKPCPDGQITVGDALVILRKALGLVNWFYMPDYFPLDSSWETDDWTLFIAQRDKDIDGATAKAMIDTRQPSVTYWTNDENGWRMHGLRDMEVGENNVPIVEFSTPIIFADAVCKIGEKKEGTFNNGKADVNYSIELLAVEDITVPAGSFNNCLKFKLHFYPSAGNPGNYGSETLYLAKGVGFVKGQTDEINGYTDFYYIFTGKGKTRRLLSYHVTKPSDLTVDQHAIKDMYKDSEKYFANENIDNYASALSDNYYDECRNKVTRRAKTEDMFNNSSNIMLFRSPGEIVVNGDKASAIGEWLISGINDSSGKRWWNWGRDRDDFIKESSEWKGYGDQLQFKPSWSGVSIRSETGGESLKIGLETSNCEGDLENLNDQIASLTITGPPGTSIDLNFKKDFHSEWGTGLYWRTEDISNATSGFYTFTLTDINGNVWVDTDYLYLDLEQPLNVPTPVSPIDHATVIPGDVVLDWNPVNGANYYRVDMENMPNVYPANATDTQAVVNLSEDNYLWRIRARRNNIYGDLDYESRSGWENFSVSSDENTITEVRYQYEFTVPVSNNSTEIWIPVPQEHPNQRDVKKIGLNIEPNKVYIDPVYGQRILYYSESELSSVDKISGVYEFISDFPTTFFVDTNNVGNYDRTSDFYKLYTRSENWIEADNPEIVNCAKTIAGDTDNPFLRANKIHNFVNSYLTSSGSWAEGITPEEYRNGYGALATYQRGSGTCQNHALLFVALCRALGIPSRTVHGVNSVNFKLDEEKNIVDWSHAWAEFYLPNYGWIPSDPIVNDFSKISNMRIILGVGNNVPLSPGCDEKGSWDCYNGKAMFLCYTLPYTDMTFKVNRFVIREKNALSNTYRMEYTYQNTRGATKIWIPVPRYWDGNGVKSVEIIEISPAPTNRSQESNGTEIAYWQTSGDTSQIFKVAFNIELSTISHNIDENRIWPSYDTNSDLYLKNTESTYWSQSDHHEIVAKANEIIGDETNPYKQAKLFHGWFANQHWFPLQSGDKEDALSVLRSERSECGGISNLFVAFCRSVGIPARNVTSLHPMSSNGQFYDGTMTIAGCCENGLLGSHVWPEFYLQGYGWVQCELGNQVGEIFNERVITAKGNDIVLGHNHPQDDLSWFHMPHIDDGSQAGDCNETWLKVEYLGPRD